MTTATATPKPTTSGPCPLCGSGSCAHWRTAALNSDGHVGSAALLAAHGIEPAIVVHDADGKPTAEGAVPLAPMEHRPSASFKRNGGRIAPLPVAAGKGIHR